MKKRFLNAVLLIALALVLFGCGNHSDTSAYEENSSTAACEHSWGDWIGTNEGHYHVCTACGMESQMFNHNCKDAYDIVGGNYVAECKVCECDVYTPVYPTIEAEDESQNAIYIAQINQAFEDLGEKAQNGDISTSMGIYLHEGFRYEELSSIDFSCKGSGEIYFELKGKNGAIFHEENGKIFVYTKGSSYDYNRKYVCSIEDFTVSSDAFVSIDVETGVDLDVSKCNITKEGDKYIIEAYAADLLGEDVTASLAELYEQYDLDSEILSKITVKIGLEFTQISYMMTTEMSMFMAVEGEIIEIPFWISTSIDFSEIEKIDFLGGDYKISPPSCIEEAYAASDATGIFKDDGGYNAIQLEKGQYYALYRDVSENADNIYSWSWFGRVRVYDETGEMIERPNLDDSDFYNYNFVIPSDGLYYLVFEGYDAYDVELIRCDYETTYDVDAPKTFGTSVSGVIEGLYDIEYYTYTSEDRQPMTIQNTSDITIYLLVNHWSYTLKAGEEITVTFEKGENQISVTAKDVTEKADYSLECTEVNE